jgi:hypothetical protein
VKADNVAIFEGCGFTPIIKAENLEYLVFAFVTDYDTFVEVGVILYKESHMGNSFLLCVIIVFFVGAAIFSDEIDQIHPNKLLPEDSFLIFYYIPIKQKKQIPNTHFRKNTLF